MRKLALLCVFILVIWSIPMTIGVSVSEAASKKTVSTAKVIKQKPKKKVAATKVVKKKPKKAAKSSSKTKTGSKRPAAKPVQKKTVEPKTAFREIVAQPATAAPPEIKLAESSAAPLKMMEVNQVIVNVPLDAGTNSSLTPAQLITWLGGLVASRDITESIVTTPLPIMPTQVIAAQAQQEMMSPTTSKQTATLTLGVKADSRSKINPNGMSDTEALACTIYKEAGGKSTEHLRYIADVVLNRVQHEKFPDSIWGVLTQPGQYSDFAKKGVRWPKRAQNQHEAAAVAQAWEVAREAIAGTHGKLYGRGYIWQAGFPQTNDYIYLEGHYFCR